MEQTNKLNQTLLALAAYSMFLKINHTAWANLKEVCKTSCPPQCLEKVFSFRVSAW